jgi:glucokinase
MGHRRCVCGSWIWNRKRSFSAQPTRASPLAAATATSIHLDGPGKFFVTGYNSRFLNTLIGEYLDEMVKLSPLRDYSIEVVPGGESVATIGAAVNASQAAERVSL